MTDIPAIKFDLPDGTGGMYFYKFQAIKLWASLERGRSTYSFNGYYRLQDDQWVLELESEVCLGYTTPSGGWKIQWQSLSQRSHQWVCDQLETADVAGMIAAHPEYVAAGGAYEQYALRDKIEFKLRTLRKHHKLEETRAESIQQELNRVQRSAALRAEEVAEAERELKEFGTVTVPKLETLSY